MNSIEKEENISVNSGFARDPRVNSNSSEIDVKFDKLLHEYKDIFREELPQELPSKHVVDHAIETDDHNPTNKNAHPLSIQQLQK